MGTIRDLGYRAYEGQRRPASDNLYVLLRYGFVRTWASWLVRLWPLIGILTAIVVVGVQLIGAGFAQDAPETTTFLRYFYIAQLWSVAPVITLRAGATVVAEDRTQRAYQFFLAKPVTSLQYMAARTIALAGSIAGILFLPSLIGIALLASAISLLGLGHEDQNLWLDVAKYIGESAGYAGIAGVVLAVLSLGASTLSRSRALTMSAWIAIFVIPHVLALLVLAITQQDWLYLGSIPGMLGIVADSIFGVEASTEAKVHWYYAAPSLAVLCALAGWMIWSRVRSVEVIT